MSKITFRADDDLVRAVEDLDASKSEVMRDALRTYLHEERNGETVAASLSDAVTERVDELVEHRLGSQQTADGEVNVRVTLEAGEGFRTADARQPEREHSQLGGDRRRQPTRLDGTNQRTQRDASPEPGRDAGHGAGRGHGQDPRNPRKRNEEGQGEACAKCGETVSADHVYCPNCGEKATHRLFCECGDEVRSDWAFCPHCGRRTASADALDG